MMVRDGRWSEAIAVGSLSFVGRVRHELGFNVVGAAYVSSGYFHVCADSSTCESASNVIKVILRKQLF
jgi:hypothetical protein